MNHKVILTEKQLDRIVRNLMEEPIIPLSRQTDINAQNVNTASWERIEGPREVPMTLSANGKENFKLGEDEINKDAPQIKKIVSDLKNFNNKGGGTATVNGSASNTAWGSFPASSSQAREKNTQLAEKRRDNLFNYLKTLLKSMKVFFNFS
jgi:S-adenosylmethionine synthetase